MTTEPNFTTDDAGIPVPGSEHSLTVGADGPIVLQDHCAVEQMAGFNREADARAATARQGDRRVRRFEVTNDVSAYTQAAVFSAGYAEPRR